LHEFFEETLAITAWQIEVYLKTVFGSIRGRYP